MAVTGYPSVTSVLPGQTVQFLLSTDAPGATPLQVARLSSAAAPPSATFQANLRTQPLPPRPWEGFQWVAAPDTTFTVPGNWPSGLYVLRSPGPDVLSFVVRQPAPGSTSRILFHVDFLTFTAYNPAGNKSLYGFNSGGEDQRATMVSLLRDWSGNPDYGPPGTAKYGYGRQLITWLESAGINVEYCSSIDLHTDPELLDNYDCLIIGGCGHDEYWTRAMRENIERFVANGGNVIVLSGNTCYRAVRLENNNTSVVFYKYPAADPNRRNEDATVAWADPPLNRPPNTLLGAGWTYGAFSGPGTYYSFRFPNHWVFAGVKATQTTPFMSYETDAAAYVEEPEGYPRVSGQDGTPLAYTVLASADLRNWEGKPGFATLGLYSRNGTVFHAGTTEWILQLQSDPAVNQITRNVFSRLGQRVPWDWEDIGHANSGSALTSLNGRLFIATSESKLWMRHPVGAEVVWRQIGHANNVIAMAGESDTLYCVTSDNQLWWRPPVETDVVWTAIGQGPAKTRSLAAAGGTLYATDTSGQLWRTPARRSLPSWELMTGFPADPTIKSMTSYADILLASTDDNRLLRSPSDFASEQPTPVRSWAPIWHCDFSIGLAVIEWMLFVATSRNRLWRLDLAGLRQP